MINKKSNDMKTINSAQIRAARAMLKITAQDLADASGVGVATVRRAESDEGGTPTKVVNQAIRAALEAAGVEFIPEGEETGEGVRLRKQSTHWINAILKADPAKRQALIERANKDLQDVGITISYRDADNCVLVDNNGQVHGVRVPDNK